MARSVAALAAAALVIVACTDGSDSSDGSADGSSGNSDAAEPLPTPESVDATLDDPSTLTVSFEPVPDAQAYHVRLDSHDEPIRFDARGCDQTCEITVDELTVAGAETTTVSAIAGPRTSEPSKPVALPAWPETPEIPQEWPEDEPVALAVVRADETGRPDIETETVPPDANVEQRIAALKSQDDVIAASIAPPVQGSEAGEGQNGDGGLQAEDFPSGLTTWQQEAMNFPALPDEPRGEDVTVAVIDDGIIANHVAIDEADITSTNMIEPGRNAPGDHATAVTSMIVGDQPWMVPGIATGVDILHYDIYNETLNEDGEFEFEWHNPADRFEALADALAQAVDDGADIINVSQTTSCMDFGDVGSLCPQDTLRPAIEYAEDHGVTVVASAGNDGDGAQRCPGTNTDSWPAAFDSVITVGGTVRDGSRWPCTPDKNYIDLLAPAANLQAAASPHGGYDVVSGTSFAAPLVSGLIATALAENPDLMPADIRGALPYSLAPNDRLLPTLFLKSLGIEMSGEPEIDLTSGREFIPFSVGLYYPQQSEVWRRAGLATWQPDPNRYSDWDDYEPHIEPYPWSSAEYEWAYLDPFTVLIGGLLVIDDDNNLTGFGGIQLTEDDLGYTVECPEYGERKPQFKFNWHVPVRVSGKLQQTDAGDNRNGQLRLSLGEGAEPNAAGELPAVHVTRDDLDECSVIIDEHDTEFQDPAYPWSEVQTWPEKKSRLVERLYQQIIDESPFLLEEGFYPPVDGHREEDTVYSSSGRLDSGVQFRLRVGDVDFYQLS